MAIIYLIRHSAPFVEIENYNDYRNISWDEYNKNMILSVAGEENAKKLCSVLELQNIDEIYASNSFRAIGTAKYIAEKNNIKIKLDERINERELGVNKIAELPNDFNKLSFANRNFKVGGGESLNEVNKRLKSFINDILNTNNKKTVIVLHGIMLLEYLQNVCDKFIFDGKTFDIQFKTNIILDGNLKNPSIYKIEFDNEKKLIDVESIKIEGDEEF